MLKNIGKPGMKIIFTLSPVRHISDGIIENNLSKSRLLCAVHSIVETHDNCEYFPSYEFLLDDLRDYRFYKEDLIHPNAMAIEYIWDKFKEAYIAEEVLPLMKKVEKINQALQHRPFNTHTIAYKKFLYSILKDIQEVEELLPQIVFRQEILELKKRIQDSY